MHYIRVRRVGARTSRPDWGQQTLDIDLPSVPVLTRWTGPLPKDAPPRALMLKLVELASAKVKGVNLDALKP